MITYVQGDLFNAPPSQLLVHACNCQGVWGSGVAAQFKKYRPIEFTLYKRFSELLGRNALGQALIINDVGCLFTSFNYGLNVDPPELILKNTEIALITLLDHTTMDIAMPKINSGLFKVPWEDTEKILNKFDHNFFVYTGE